jgi:hypothetical protein
LTAGNAEIEAHGCSSYAALDEQAIQDHAVHHGVAFDGPLLRHQTLAFVRLSVGADPAISVDRHARPIGNV